MWSLLISVSTEVEADIIKGLLDQSQIQVQKKYPLGSLKDSYGIENGVELWVPSDVLDQARTLINEPLQDLKTVGIDQDDEEEEWIETGEKPEPEPMYKKSLLMNNRALVTILLVLVIVIYWLIKGSEMF